MQIIFDMDIKYVIYMLVSDNKIKNCSTKEIKCNKNGNLYQNEDLGDTNIIHKTCKYIKCFWKKVAKWQNINMSMNVQKKHICYYVIIFSNIWNIVKKLLIYVTWENGKRNAEEDSVLLFSNFWKWGQIHSTNCNNN